MGEKIGYGGFADVFEAKCKNFGFQDVSVAIKKVSMDLYYDLFYSLKILAASF